MEAQLDLFQTKALEHAGAWKELPEEARQEVIELLARLVLAYGRHQIDEVRDEL